MQDQPTMEYVQMTGLHFVVKTSFPPGVSNTPSTPPVDKMCLWSTANHSTEYKDTSLLGFLHSACHLEQPCHVPESFLTWLG